MDHRRAALSAVHQFLYSRRGQWVIRFRFQGLARQWRLLWHEDEAERAETYSRLEQILAGTPQEGELRLRQLGAPRSLTTVFPWPGAPDLFSAGDPAPVQQPVEIRRDAGGNHQAGPVKIPGLVVRLADLVMPPRKANIGCAKAILALLYRTQKRHTGMDLLLALEKSDQNYPWCQATIEASATWLRREGAVDNDRDHKGTGYGLVYWEVDPLGGEPH